MNTFVLHLQSGTQYECFRDATSFVGSDSSGSFGLQAGHCRMMASLTMGLAKFQTSDGAWRYLALPGALVYFIDNELYLNTRRYLQGKDYTKISEAWQKELLTEEDNLRSVKDSLYRLEDEILKRLWNLQRDSRIGA